MFLTFYCEFFYIIEIKIDINIKSSFHLLLLVALGDNKLSYLVSSSQKFKICKISNFHFFFSIDLSGGTIQKGAKNHAILLK